MKKTGKLSYMRGGILYEDGENCEVIEFFIFINKP